MARRSRQPACQMETGGRTFTVVQKYGWRLRFPSSVPPGCGDLDDEMEDVMEEGEAYRDLDDDVREEEDAEALEAEAWEEGVMEEEEAKEKAWKDEGALEAADDDVAEEEDAEALEEALEKEAALEEEDAKDAVDNEAADDEEQLAMELAVELAVDKSDEDEQPFLSGATACPKAGPRRARGRMESLGEDGGSSDAPSSLSPASWMSLSPR